jgi:hypothetical protein
MSWLSGYGTYSTRLSTQPQTHTMHSGTYTFLLTLHVLTDTFFKHEQAQGKARKNGISGVCTFVCVHVLLVSPDMYHYSGRVPYNS